MNEEYKVVFGFPFLPNGNYRVCHINRITAKEWVRTRNPAAGVIPKTVSKELIKDLGNIFNNDVTHYKTFDDNNELIKDTSIRIPIEAYLVAYVDFDQPNGLGYAIINKN